MSLTKFMRNPSEVPGVPKRVGRVLQEISGVPEEVRRVPHEFLLEELLVLRMFQILKWVLAAIQGVLEVCEEVRVVLQEASGIPKRFDKDL